MHGRIRANRSTKLPLRFLSTSFSLRGWHGSGVPSGIAFVALVALFTFFTLLTLGSLGALLSRIPLWSLSARHTWFTFFALRAFKTSRKRKGGGTEYYQRWEAHKFLSSKLENGSPIWSIKNTPNTWLGSQGELAGSKLIVVISWLEVAG
jgi:hypothetical protein